MTCPCCLGPTDSEQTDPRCSACRVNCTSNWCAVRPPKRCGAPIPGPTLTPQQLAAAARARAFLVPVEDTEVEDPDYGF